MTDGRYLVVEKVQNETFLVIFKHDLTSIEKNKSVSSVVVAATSLLSCLQNRRKTPRKIETAFWVSAFLFTLRGS